MVVACMPKWNVGMAHRRRLSGAAFKPPYGAVLVTVWY
jgi:hypothetical protein